MQAQDVANMQKQPLVDTAASVKTNENVFSGLEGSWKSEKAYGVGFMSPLTLVRCPRNVAYVEDATRLCAQIDGLLPGRAYAIQMVEESGGEGRGEALTPVSTIAKAWTKHIKPLESYPVTGLSANRKTDTIEVRWRLQDAADVSESFGLMGHLLKLQWDNNRSIGITLEQPIEAIQGYGGDGNIFMANITSEHVLTSIFPFNGTITQGTLNITIYAITGAGVLPVPGRTSIRTRVDRTCGLLLGENEFWCIKSKIKPMLPCETAALASNDRMTGPACILQQHAAVAMAYMGREDTTTSALSFILQSRLDVEAMRSLALLWDCRKSIGDCIKELEASRPAARQSAQEGAIRHLMLLISDIGHSPAMWHADNYFVKDVYNPCIGPMLLAGVGGINHFASARANKHAILSKIFRNAPDLPPSVFQLANLTMAAMSDPKAMKQLTCQNVPWITGLYDAISRSRAADHLTSAMKRLQDSIATAALQAARIQAGDDSVHISIPPPLMNEFGSLLDGGIADLQLHFPDATAGPQALTFKGWRSYWSPINEAMQLPIVLAGQFYGNISLVAVPVAERGGESLAAKVERAAKAGAPAIIIYDDAQNRCFNDEFVDRCVPGSRAKVGFAAGDETQPWADARIPAFLISRSSGMKLIQTLARH
jgi:hypothetical protein